MPPTFGVVDLFAGSGGLGEGFSAFRDERGGHPFSIEVSVERDSAAHSTLQLRSFLHKFGDRGLPPEYYEFLNHQGDEPKWSSVYPNEWAAAEQEAKQLEIGTRTASNFLKSRISAIHQKYGDNTILIGGPPCQAYSLVGRSRNAGIAGYLPHKDDRNFLYRKYVNVLRQLEPAAFVMENVRGMLSSNVDGNWIFRNVLGDLRSATGKDSYQLFALTSKKSIGEEIEPLDFVVRMENHGVPQARHRVIIVGLRSDFANKLPSGIAPLLKCHESEVTVHDVIGRMPKLRSGLKQDDNFSDWREEIEWAISVLLEETSKVPRPHKGEFKDTLRKYKAALQRRSVLERASTNGMGWRISSPSSLHDFLTDPNLESIPNNETRSHMEEDLARYLYAAVFSRVVGHSPKSQEFPAALAPKHKNWKSGKFADRFRVQIADRPATTVTSHLSKDGHYFIHPDPLQCRSLTVREAARLQTFPDNYFFKGNRTQQYVQVGNAVPPFLARQIAESLWGVLATPMRKKSGIHAKKANS